MAASEAARTQAREDLRDKIKLEKDFIRKLTTLNNKIVKKTVLDFGRDGVVLNAREFEPELAELLENQYDRAARVFSDQIRDVLPKELESTEKEDLLIAGALAVFFAARVIDQSQIITRTNQRDITQSIVSADRQLQEAAEVGQIVSNREVARTAGVLLKRKLKGRTGTIATTEVQVAAESSKATETSILTRNKASLPRPVIAIPQPQVVVPELPLGLPPPKVDKEWVTAGDEVVRTTPFSHVAADGLKVNIDESFDVGGQLLRIPGDTSQGASLGNVINCLHPESVVDASNIKALTRRYYKGVMIRIELPSGDKLTVTPNHPILTVDGWVFAKDINKGDRVLGCFDGDRNKKGLNVENVKSTIEQEFNSFCKLGIVMRISCAIVNFHGEIPDHDIDIVNANGLLWNTGESHITDAIDKKTLAFTDFGAGKLFSNCLLNGSFFIPLTSFFSDCIVSIFGKRLPIFKRSVSHSLIHCLGSIPRFNTTENKAFFNHVSCVSGFFMDSLYRKPIVMIRKYLFESAFVNFVSINSARFFFTSDGYTSISDYFQALIAVDSETLDAGIYRKSTNISDNNIVSVEHVEYSGYVYNIETESNIYFSEGVINHNCRCASVRNKKDVLNARKSIFNAETRIEAETEVDVPEFGFTS